MFDDIKIIFNDDTVGIRNENLNSELVFDTDSKEYSYFFINSFFNKYFSGEDAAVKTNSPINEKYIVLECQADGARFKKQKLWIDIKTVLPAKMEIIDSDNNIAARIVFESFSFNEKIDDSLFILSSDAQ